MLSPVEWIVRASAITEKDFLQDLQCFATGHGSGTKYRRHPCSQMRSRKGTSDRNGKKGSTGTNEMENLHALKRHENICLLLEGNYDL